MKKLLILPLWIYSLAVFAAPAITNVSYDGAFSKGTTITISGTDFGSHTDYDGNGGAYLCEMWDDFETGTRRTSSGYWDGWNSSSVVIVSGGRTGSSYYADQPATSDAGLSHYGDPTQDIVYISGWRQFETCTNPEDASNWKVWRIYSDSPTHYPDWAIVISDGTWDDVPNNCTIIWGLESCNSSNNHGGTFGSGFANWQLYEIEVDKPNNTTKLWVDGVDLMTTEIYAGDMDTCSFELYNIIYDAYHRGGGGAYSVLTDDCYISYTRARIILSDSSTWSTSVASHRELQLPTAWSTTSITATVNMGSFTTGTAYLYIVDSNGLVSNGYAITLGGTEGTPTVTGGYLTNSSAQGQPQANPNASLGGYRSTTPLSTISMKNLFDNVTVAEALVGDTEYRMIDVYNAGTTDATKVQIFMKTPTSSPGTEIAFGASMTDQPHADNWNGEALANESTAPASPAFTFANRTRGSPLSLGTIPAGQSVRVGVRRTVDPLTLWTSGDVGVIGIRYLSD